MLTHIDKNNKPTMVDVSAKSISMREAIARVTICLPVEVQAMFDGDDIKSKKGPVFNTAIIAGTMAVKKTHELIPFCHPLLLESIKVSIDRMTDSDVVIECSVKNEGKTGVEMEALIGANIAALTIYDMCKAASQNIVIKEARLLKKTGGKTNFSLADEGKINE